ncbi:MAG: glycosyltransferase family 2 protein [Bacteroidia bacterium]|nr:glycosyltransferase family 2 protein [Bacteroidia bacterium]MDW8332754.1 glycosyltransferase family 2 protein [Bacteroidia bacterium]
METAFWILTATLAFTYLGYGPCVALLSRLKRRRTLTPSAALPAVTVVVPAYNEADWVEAKVENCRRLDYPPELLSFWFVTDGSDDGTPELLRRHENVRVFHRPERAGKTAAVNRIMPLVPTPVTVFTDMNAMLNPTAVRSLVRHFADPQVGCVAGEKRVCARNAAGAGENLYWRYESWMKKWDSDFHSTVGAAGELFAIRTELFRPPESDAILDDFLISMHVALMGYRIVYEPDAYAVEGPSAGLGEELKRKIRICAGGFQTLRRRPELLNFFRRPTLAFQFFWRRVARWLIAPVALVLILPLNVVLAVRQGGIYTPLLVVQATFYFAAWLGWMARERKNAFVAPLYFLMMHYAALAGLYRHLFGKQPAAWIKSKRSAL